MNFPLSTAGRGDAFSHQMSGGAGRREHHDEVAQRREPSRLRCSRWLERTRYSTRFFGPRRMQTCDSTTSERSSLRSALRNGLVEVKYHLSES